MILSGLGIGRHYRSLARKNDCPPGATTTQRAIFLYNRLFFATGYERQPMVHSMTAFARSEQAGPHGTLSWEIRSVNHRYLEPHLRLPEAFRDLEGPVRDALRKGLSRGKVECTLRFAEEKAGSGLQVEAAQSVAELIDQSAPISPLDVLAWPGVLVAESADPQALNQSALKLFHMALEQLRQGRQREGEELARLIDERLDGILEHSYRRADGVFVAG